MVVMRLLEGIGYREHLGFAEGFADNLETEGHSRLSWHITSSGTGYRVGETTGLNSSDKWERVVLVRCGVGGLSGP